MDTLKQKPVMVKAVQYNGMNKDSLRKMFNLPEEHEFNLGDWVMLATDKRIYVIRNDNIIRTYEAKK